jgi:hypothetical protein
MVFVELYTVMPVTICESFHDVHCLKLTNCIPEFCLDLVHVIKFLSLQSQLKFWANKDHVANLVSTKGMEQQSFYFLARNSGRHKAE